MSKFLSLLIIFLFAINFYLFNYLQHFLISRKAYDISFTDKPLIYQKKELLLDDSDSFDFNYYFDVLSINDYSFSYYFKDEKLYIKINNGSVYEYVFDYLIKPVPVIEKEIIKEIYVNRNEPISEIPKEIKQENKPLTRNNITINNNHFSFKQYTDISNIIAAISSNIVSNESITIDYSSLNPNVPGIYTVYIISSENTYSLTIEIM